MPSAFQNISAAQLVATMQSNNNGSALRIAAAEGLGEMRYQGAELAAAVSNTNYGSDLRAAAARALGRAARD